MEDECHIFKANDSEKDVWRLKTLADYMILAEAIANESAPQTQNILGQGLCYIYRDIQRALGAAYSMIQNVRKEDICIRNIRPGDYERFHSTVCIDNKQIKCNWQLPFILNYCKLFEHTNRASKKTIDTDDEILQCIPKNPRTTAFDIAGFSAHEAILGFLEEIKFVLSCNLVWELMKATTKGVIEGWVTPIPEARLLSYITGECSFREDCSAFIVEPEPDEFVASWIQLAKDKVESFLPLDDWSNSAVKREINTLYCQLNYEYEQTIIVLKKQGNNSGKTKAKKTRKRRKRKTKITSEQQYIWEQINQGTTIADLAEQKGCSMANISQQYAKAEAKLKKLNSGSRSIDFQKTQRIPTDERGQEIV